MVHQLLHGWMEILLEKTSSDGDKGIAGCYSRFADDCTFKGRSYGGKINIKTEYADLSQFISMADIKNTIAHLIRHE